MSPIPDFQQILAHFDMQPHPEGGYYCQSFKSSHQAEIPGFDGPRSYSTAIYFMLTEQSKSHLHRLKSDEVWHFYLGSAIQIVEITPDGELIETRLGQNIMAGECLQYTVKAGHWFGSYSLNQSDYALVGCTVAPGFEFADFEMAKKADLTAVYPHLAETIEYMALD